MRGLHGGPDCGAVIALVDDLEPHPGTEDAAQTAPDELLVIHQEHARHSGMVADTTHSRSTGPAVRFPPSKATRSAMPRTPRPSHGPNRAIGAPLRMSRFT